MRRKRDILSLSCDTPFQKQASFHWWKSDLFCEKGKQKPTRYSWKKYLWRDWTLSEKWQNFSSIIHPLSIQTPTTGEPCLQAIDYINWAVYRAFVKREDRFINFLLPKIDLVWDIYADKIRYTDWSFRVPYSDNTVWFYTKRNFALEGVAHLSDTKTSNELAMKS